MKTALLAFALLLPGMAMAGDLPVCPIQPGAVICSDPDAFGPKLGHRARGDFSYDKEKSAALATGKCKPVAKLTKTVAVAFDELLTNQGDIIKVKTADKPNQWQFASVYLMYENPRDFYFGTVKCGLHPKMQDYEID